MTNWDTFRTEAPEMAAKVEARFTAHKHHVMATLRRDGGPRVSGTEVVLDGDDLYLGSMWHARKALDLIRDPRVAVHSNPGDESMTGGDARVSARATEVPDGHAAKELVRTTVQPPEPFHLFRLEPVDVVLIQLDHDADALLTQLWRPGAGVTTTVVT